MNWVFYLRNVICLTLISATVNLAQAQFYRVNSEVPFASSMPLIPANDPNQVGILTPGSVIEILEKQAMVARIKIWLLVQQQNQKIRKEEEYWIFKDDSPETEKIFTRIEPARRKQDAVEQVTMQTEAKLPTVECENCTDTQVSAVTQPTIENKNDLQAVNEKAAKVAQSSGDPKLDEQIRNYSQSDQVKNAIRFAKARATRSRGQCYRSVKKALDAGVARGKVPLTPGPYIASVAARYAVDDLQKEPHNFINLLDKPGFKDQIKSAADAPKGAVLVYSSGIRCGGSGKVEKDCGHVEIKTDQAGKPGYVSDFYSTTPITATAANRLRPGAKYRLIGVMIKPMDVK